MPEIFRMVEVGRERISLLVAVSGGGRSLIWRPRYAHRPTVAKKLIKKKMTQKISLHFAFACEFLENVCGSKASGADQYWE